jgi:hypothetical protein
VRASMCADAQKLACRRDQIVAERTHPDQRTHRFTQAAGAKAGRFLTVSRRITIGIHNLTSSAVAHFAGPG